MQFKNFPKFQEGITFYHNKNIWKLSIIEIRDYINITGRLEPLLQPKDESRGSHLPQEL